MSFNVDQYVLEHCFNYLADEEGNVFYWAKCNTEGYIVLFQDGEHLHTYHYPPDWLLHDDKK